ncbi:MAG: hypothetical protein HGB36_09480 [Chlorobiaceae bacterium]|jgi:hypothetical protein|nr:hypothetical protein [Chlorobiaceae bacterium]
MPEIIKTIEPRINTDKPVETGEIPLLPSRPAVEDLHFIFRESLRLGMNLLSEVDRMVKKLKQG